MNDQYLFYAQEHCSTDAPNNFDDDETVASQTMHF